MIDFWEIKNFWREILDIGLVSFIFYRLILLMRGTRAASVFLGLLMLAGLYYFAELLNLYTLHWLLDKFFASLFLVIVILFQRDIRNALSRVGTSRFWHKRIENRDFQQLTAAILVMAKQKTGALVVIEKNVALGDLVERGITVSAKISSELLQTIFCPDTPLHDGAVIISGNSIQAAGCILPLAIGTYSRREIGTRHRAALGITSETDAIAIVVSEERGEITIATNGKLTAPLDEVRLKRTLKHTWEK